MFKEGQKVKIVSVEELRRLKEEEDMDIVSEMFEFAGQETTIITVIPKEERFHPDIPEYEIAADGEYWTWYDELLMPVK